MDFDFLQTKPFNSLSSLTHNTSSTIMQYQGGEGGEGVKRVKYVIDRKVRIDEFFLIFTAIYNLAPIYIINHKFACTYTGAGICS